eukprot:Skav227429  [mRNA]  locus=scaffold203:12896:19845:+ [translate_table: standard]
MHELSRSFVTPQVLRSPSLAQSRQLIEIGRAMSEKVVDPKVVATSGSAWTDPQFPPDRFSLGDPAGETWPDEKLRWIRAVDLAEDPVIFGDPGDASDASQGGVGNCNMLAALACLADFPGYLNLLFLTKAGHRKAFELCLDDISLP